MGKRMVDIDDLNLVVSERDRMIYLTPLTDNKMNMDLRREMTKETTVAIANWMMEHESIFIDIDDGETYIFNIDDPRLMDGIRQLMKDGLPIVPKMVSQWYDGNKENLEKAIRDMIVTVSKLEDAEPWNLTILQKWFMEKNAIEIISRMRFGYMVEDS